MKIFSCLHQLRVCRISRLQKTRTPQNSDVVVSLYRRRNFYASVNSEKSVTKNVFINESRPLKLNVIAPHCVMHGLIESCGALYTYACERAIKSLKCLVSQKTQNHKTRQKVNRQFEYNAIFRDGILILL